jgi:hypothetical protein
MLDALDTIMRSLPLVLVVISLVIISYRVREVARRQDLQTGESAEAAQRQMQALERIANALERGGVPQK